MAIKTISQFPPGTPTDNDYILFEQNGEGKSATIGDAVNTYTLTYEEIMATNPVPDLTNKVASASVLKTLSDNLSSFSILKSQNGIFGAWNIDNLDSYPKGQGILHFSSFYYEAASGTLPFQDGHLLTFIWRNSKNNPLLSQIAVEDDNTIIKMRKYSNGAWSAWKSISIS